MENLEIYNKYRQVPAEALKPFDNGNFKGTDINSMWRIKCLTEQFGVVGHGWTTKVLRTWTETDANTNEVLAFAEIEMKVKVDGEWGEPFTATGGNKLSTYVKSKDYYKTSDEAFKMAITDAFGVACKYLGIGADVYWANDKSKYTENEEKPKTPPTSHENGKVEQVANKEDNKPMTLEEAYEIKVNTREGWKKLQDLDLDKLEVIVQHSAVVEWVEGAKLIIAERKKNG